MMKLKLSGFFLLTTFLISTLLYAQNDEQNSNALSYPVVQSASEYDYPPFALVGQDGEVDGFAVELLTQALAVMNRSVEFKVGPWQVISDDLRYGRIDVLPFVGRTPAREDYFDFTIPYITIHGMVVTRTQNNQIQSVSDLKDKKILVMEDDTAHEYVLRADVADSLVLTESYEEALTRLSDGECDAVVMQSIVALDLMNRLNITNLKIVGGPIEEYSQEFCFAVQEGDRQLLSLLNEGLAILIENGTVHDLQTQWFTEDITTDSLPVVARSLLFTFIIIIAGLLLMEFAHRREHQRQRREIERAKAQLASIVENSTDAIFSHDLDGYITTWNSGAAEMYGYSRDEIIGKSVSKIFSDRDKNVADLFQNQIKNDHVIQNREVTHLTKSGEELIVSLSMSPMLNDSDTIIGASVISHDITARKLAEEALRKSENRFRRIFDEAPYGAAIVSLNYEYMLINRSLSQITGYSASELTGKKFTEITHSDDLDEDLSYTEQLLSGEIEQYDNEKRYIRKDGSHVRVSISVRLMKDSDGKPLYFLPMIEDITEKREAEKKIRDNRSNLRSMIENTQDSIWAVDLNYNITIVNSVYKHLFKAYFGKELNEGDYILDIVPEENKKDWIEVVERAKDGKFWITNQSYTIQGQEMHFEISHNPILNSQGQVVGLSMQSQDVTERKKAERALKESERDFRNIIDHMQEGFYRITMDGTILMVNPWLMKILECNSEKELINKNVNELEFGLANNREEFIQKLLSEESIQHYQATWNTKTGKEIQVRENAHIIRSSQGEVIFYEGTVEDITDQVHLQEQLRQSQKMEAVGQLAGGIAHDFNNLLTVINGYSGLLISQVDHLPEIQEDLQVVHDAGVRAEKLTRQLLAFSRRQQLQPEVLDINELILDLKKMLTRIIGEHIQLHTDVAEDIWPVKVDPGQMEQVIINIAVNARDAMPGGGRLQITTQNVYDSVTEISEKGTSMKKPFVEIQLQDSGNGMSEETIERIFEPFYTTKDKGKGTGLGLATVYGIVKQSGGDIRVESSPGTGTRFTILVPKSAAQPENVPDTIGMADFQFGNQTVLLAEDEKTVRDFVTSGLESHGFKVISAYNGEEALQKFTEHLDEIDLVITDVVMPKMSGPEMIQIMNESSRSLPVIYISGYSDEMLLQIQRLDDLSEFVQKPFTTPVLLNKIKELLERVQSNERID